MKNRDLKSAKILKNNVLSMIHARQDEIKELERQYRELESFIDSYPHSHMDFGDKSEQKKNNTNTNSKKEDVAAGAYKLVKMRGQPIKRDELFDLLINQGFVITGKNPQMILSTMLWRAKDSGLVRLKGGGYWLKEQSYEPAGYHPERKPYKSKDSRQIDLISQLSQ